MKIFVKIIGIAFLVSFGTLQAAMVWTEEKGWHAEGGLAEEYFGKTMEVEDARQCMGYANELYEQCDVKGALGLYNKVYCDWPQSRSAPEALFRSGKIYMERQQYDAAFSQFQRIIMDYPGYTHFNEVIAAQFKLASELQCGKRPYYWGIIPGFRDYSASMNYFESIVVNAPASDYAPMALMNIADISKEQGKREMEIDALERLVSNYRHSDLAPQAYIRLAEAQESLVYGPDYDQGATQKAINYYQDFLFLFPDHELAGCAETGLKRAQETLALSKKEIGDFYYLYRNNPCAARIYYNETITVAPKSCAAEEAKVMIEKIDNCIEPPMNPADWVFGRYERLSTPAYLDELEMAKKDTEKFETFKEVHLDEAIEDFEEEHVIQEHPSSDDKDMENIYRVEDQWIANPPGPDCAPQEYECCPDGSLGSVNGS